MATASHVDATEDNPRASTGNDTLSNQNLLRFINEEEEEEGMVTAADEPVVESLTMTERLAAGAVAFVEVKKGFVAP